MRLFEHFHMNKPGFKTSGGQAENVRVICSTLVRTLGIRIGNMRIKPGFGVAIICACLATRSASPVEEQSIPLRYEEPKFLAGRIFAKDSDRKNCLFRFTRKSTRSGLVLHVLREYTYPNGRVAARERITYLGDDLTSYELEELQIGAAGRAEILPNPRLPGKDRIFFEYSNDVTSKSKPKTDSEPLGKETLDNDTIAPFLQWHWDDLMSGREVKCRYIVIPRRETVGFTFKKQSQSPSTAPRVITVKMEATSPIISALIDPLFFALEQDPPHRVLEYSGRTTPKIKSGSKWKDLDAVTVFDWPKVR
jgi:hypothetical protein